jgi:hypothetical protein
VAEIKSLDSLERVDECCCVAVKSAGFWVAYDDAKEIIDAQAARIAELERIAAYRGDEIRRQDRLIGHGCAGTAHVKALTARIAELEAQLGRVEEVRKTMCLVGAMHWASRLANAMHTEPRG